MYRNICLIMAVAGLLAGCGKQTHPQAKGKEDAAPSYEGALEAAQLARDKATQAGNEWTGAQALMEDAARLAADGNPRAAAAMLDEARLQYELAVAQSEREAADWRKRVLR